MWKDLPDISQLAVRGIGFELGSACKAHPRSHAYFLKEASA